MSTNVQLEPSGHMKKYEIRVIRSALKRETGMTRFVVISNCFGCFSAVLYFHTEYSVEAPL